MSTLYAERLRGAANPHWKGGLRAKQCPVCESVFYVQPCLVESSHYCSTACSAIGRTKPKQARIKVGHSFAKGECGTRCKLCGVPIQYGRVYCKTCSPRGKRIMTSFCEVCGKAIQHWVGLRRRYCSTGCARQRQYAEGNPNWKGGRLPLASRIRGCEKNRRLVASALRRDKYTCQLCGQVGGDLEVDHIKPFAEILEEFLTRYQVLSIPVFQYELSLIALKHKPFWEKSNLRTLCRHCNWNRHLEAWSAR